MSEINYLTLSEHINQIKNDSEKMDHLRKTKFDFNLPDLFEQVQDDLKVYEILKNLSLISTKIKNKFGQVKKKDIPLIRENPKITRHETWISSIYANKIAPFEDEFYHYYWAREIFSLDVIFPLRPTENRLFLILKEWRKNTPDKRVLKELKWLLNIVDDFEDYYSGKKMNDRTSIIQTTLHVIQDKPDMIPIEFVHLLIHFGSEFKEMDCWILHVSRTSLIKARKWMEVYSEFEKIFFGMKINKWGTKWMDDSVDFSPMRAKINLTNTLELMEKKEGKE